MDTPSHGTAARRVIIDTDPGIDDMLALFLAFGSTSIIVEGLTIVCGNGKDIKKLGANAKLLARIAGCPGVPGVLPGILGFAAWAMGYPGEQPRGRAVGLPRGVGGGDGPSLKDFRLGRPYQQGISILSTPLLTKVV